MTLTPTDVAQEDFDFVVGSVGMAVPPGETADWTFSREAPYRRRYIVMVKHTSGNFVLRVDGKARSYHVYATKTAMGWAERADGVLRAAAALLPAAMRADWLEEHRRYLADLPTRRAKARWLYRELRGMPRYAYVVRTNARKEAA